MGKACLNKEVGTYECEGGRDTYSFYLSLSDIQDSSNEEQCRNKERLKDKERETFKEVAVLPEVRNYLVESSMDSSRIQSTTIFLTGGMKW
ncbi:CFC_HP_G0102230.mRNA.1.CDS.1 [Saccharomyces cerevisiae]|nr:CFC_HP_G0102230.mRNA.1.CDS.1 [Saccharomyces cerevisiae]CAI6903617.1 CFC_HP_G0102230.mRNA.1.CDS.1 [Saccharomyces cerevisiae]